MVINVNPCGIVRKIDGLHRFVVPKEIVDDLGLRQGDPMEVMYDREKGVILLRKCVVRE